MEELFDQHDFVRFSAEPLEEGQLGQSWEEISRNVEQALRGQRSPSSSQDTRCSRSKPARAPSPSSKSKSVAKEQLVVRRENGPAACPQLKLKLERSSTEQQNVASRQLLSKRSLSEFQSLSSPDAVKTDGDVPFAFRKLQSQESSLLSHNNFGLQVQHKQKISLGKTNEKAPKCRNNTKEELRKRSEGKEIHADVGRASKSQSSLLMVPAKVDIFIKQKHHSEPKTIEKSIGGVFYRKETHLQQYSHLRANPNLSPPPSQPQQESIHATASRQRWQFVRLSLSKSGKELRAREKELQLGLQRQLMQASKGSKICTSKHRLKLG